VAVSGGPIAPLNVQPKNYSCGAEIFDFTKGMPQVTGLHGGHGHTDLIKATAFSPDGESWATGSLDCDLKIWKIQLQHPLPSVLKQPSGVVGLTYSADGKSIAVATLKDGVLLWNLDAPLTPDKPPESKQLYSPDEGQALATSHDGTLLAYINNDVRLTIYDWKAKSTVTTLPEIKGNTFVIAFSPNDKFLATGGDSNQVELWDAATGKHVATFTGHSEPIRSLAFFPTRPELLSLAGDGTVRIWDVSKYVEK
jgi:WD40 repeat protein